MLKGVWGEGGGREGKMDKLGIDRAINVTITFHFIHLFFNRNIHSSFHCSHIAHLVEEGRGQLNIK